MRTDVVTQGEFHKTLLSYSVLIMELHVNEKGILGWKQGNS